MAFGGRWLIGALTVANTACCLPSVHCYLLSPGQNSELFGAQLMVFASLTPLQLGMLQEMKVGFLGRFCCPFLLFHAFLKM